MLYAMFFESPNPRKLMRQTAPISPRVTPTICIFRTDFLKTKYPTMSVKSGVSAFKMPDMLECKNICEFVKRKAGMPLPNSPTTTYHQINSRFNQLLKMNAKGSMTKEAMPNLKAAT